MIMGILVVLAVLGSIALAIRAETHFFRGIAIGVAVIVLGIGWVSRPHPPSPPLGWTWPVDPTVMPALNASGQVFVLNASVYPVALVAITDTTALRRLNAAYTAPSRTPRHIAFVALIDPHPASNAAALQAARAVMKQVHDALPWAILIDPPPADSTPGVQLDRPTAHGVAHLTGSALWAAWTHAVAPLPAPPVVPPPKVRTSHSSVSASQQHPSRRSPRAATRPSSNQGGH